MPSKLTRAGFGDFFEGHWFLCANFTSSRHPGEYLLMWTVGPGYDFGGPFRSSSPGPFWMSFGMVCLEHGLEDIRLRSYIAAWIFENPTKETQRDGFRVLSLMTMRARKSWTHALGNLLRIVALGLNGEPFPKGVAPWCKAGAASRQSAPHCCNIFPACSSNGAPRCNIFLKALKMETYWTPSTGMETCACNFYQLSGLCKHHTGRSADPHGRWPLEWMETFEDIHSGNLT